MKKIISVVGTRPQFIKLAPLCYKLKNRNDIKHIIIHSGQHYDKEMSKDLFYILNIPEPDYLFQKKGSTHAEITGFLMMDIEKIFIEEAPDMVLVFGDCDTTIAGALVAKKLVSRKTESLCSKEIKLVHIESGMRSYNKNMPEEINRVMTDHISDILLCSTQDSVDNLNKENIKDNVFYVGNLQLDLLKLCIEKYQDRRILNDNKLKKDEFVLMTIHRHYNTNKDTLTKIFIELEKLKIKIVFPIHPRTKNIITKNQIKLPNNLILIPPVNYLDMTMLERTCKYIITDSGGVQPEAWYLGKKCIVLRSETEWLEPLNNNNNVLYDWKKPLNEFIHEFLKVDIKKNKIDINASLNIINILSSY